MPNYNTMIFSHSFVYDASPQPGLKRRNLLTMLVLHQNPLHQCHVLIKNARPRSKGSKFSVRGSQVPLPSNRNELERILKARQRALERELTQCSPAQLEHLLTSVKAKEEPCRLNKHLSNVRYKGFTALIVEVMPLLPSEPPATLVRRCVDYVSWGADAISIRTDLEASSTGLQTLSMVSQAVNVPLICSDWIIHPIQIAQAVEAGASSVRLVYAVIKKGLKPHLRYANSLGLDAIVEVVNLNELEDVSKMGVSVYGMNLSVGLSVKLPVLGCKRIPSFACSGHIHTGESVSNSRSKARYFQISN